jgi:hypothetical protein
VATFSNLTINKTDSGSTLLVSSGSLSSATSSPIDVTKTGKAPSPLTASAASTASEPSLAPLVLVSPDLWSGVVLKKRRRLY